MRTRFPASLAAAAPVTSAELAAYCRAVSVYNDWSGTWAETKAGQDAQQSARDAVETLLKGKDADWRRNILSYVRSNCPDSDALLDLIPVSLPSTPPYVSPGRPVRSEDTGAPPRFRPGAYASPGRPVPSEDYGMPPRYFPVPESAAPPRPMIPSTSQKVYFPSPVPPQTPAPGGEGGYACWLCPGGQYMWGLRPSPACQDRRLDEASCSHLVRTSSGLVPSVAFGPAGGATSFSMLGAAGAAPAPRAKVSVHRRELAAMLGKVTGLGADLLTASATQIAERVFNALLPQLKTIVADAAEAAEPTIRTVVREELAPKVALGMGTAMFFSAALSGIVGAWFASRARRQ